MITSTATASLEVEDLLDAKDRCDKCQAQAYVLVVLPEELTLMFCGHHWNEYSDKLLEIAIDIVDETDKLSRR